MAQPTAKVTATSVEFSPDGSLLAAFFLDHNEKDWFKGRICLWDAKTGKLVWKVVQNSQKWFPARLSFSPDGRTLVVANGGVVTLRAVADGAVQKEFETPLGLWVKPVVFSPNGKLLTALSLLAPEQTGQGLFLWDNEGKPVQALDLAGSTLAEGATFSPDGKSFALPFYSVEDEKMKDGTVRVWDAATRGTPTEMTCTNAVAHGVSYSPDGKTLAFWGEKTGGAAHALVSMLDQDGNRNDMAYEDHGGATSAMTAAQFSGDGKTLRGLAIVKEGANCTITSLEWTVQTGALLSENKLLTLAQEEAAFASARLSPDGAAVMFSTSGGTIELKDAKTGASVRKFE